LPVRTLRNRIPALQHARNALTCTSVEYKLRVGDFRGESLVMFEE